LPLPERVAALEDLRRRAEQCVKCPHLARARRNVVFGVGSPAAELMFVGEAPGAEEDAQGEPFVGRAGELLTRIIQAMGHGRDTVYIANVLKCRPDTPGRASGNRPPTAAEMDTCRPYLAAQIELIQPRAIVALGATAVQGLLGLTATMGSLRGRWQQFRGLPVMPTYHPAYLLRAQDAADGGRSEKRKVWEDLLLVLEKLGAPVTEKMRGYFLKAG
jgi:DNA polymerase